MRRRNDDIRFARRVLEGASHLAGEQVDEKLRVDVPPSSAPKPHWDKERRELRVGNTVVKRFRVPAENQELILSAFEEEGWPGRIDDPLVPIEGVAPKRRLRATLASLNHGQRECEIHFYADGTGCGICWELVENTAQDAEQQS